YYKRKAADLNIPLHINTVHFQKCHVSDSELTIVFGNLLENAIEACNRIPEEDRFITLKIKNVESSLVAIICENSFDGILNQRNGKILSRKKEGGIGLSSIESIALKYHGIMKIQAEQNNFKIYVSLSECIF
ncbi:MAG: ATP-binding protein, partial [Lachnospiraceae bacterium]